MKKNVKQAIEEPVFWMLLVGVAYMAIDQRHWPSMLTLLLFVCIIIPIQYYKIHKKRGKKDE